MPDKEKNGAIFICKTGSSRPAFSFLLPCRDSVRNTLKEKYDNTAIIKTDYEETSTSIWEQLAESGMENAPHVFEEDAEFDESKFETPEDKYFALAYEENGRIFGRIAGHIDYKCMILFVDALAVEKEARGKKIGQQLIDELEKIGAYEGCVFSFFYTYNFSAPAFYEKQGYEIFGTLTNAPKGHTHYYMKKTL